MPCSLSLGESWQLETHSLRAQMSGIRLWHSWLGAGIVEPSNGARSWMFEGKSRLQMFPNRCNRSLPLHCSTYRTVYSSPVVTAGRRQRLESELHSVQDHFQTQKWEIALH